MISRLRAPGAPPPALPPVLLPVTPIVSTDRPPRLPKQ
jgi:hypothetical protein